MDKYEYKHLVEQIQNLIDLGEYAEAAAIADKIDWRRVRSVMTLGTISDLYKINNRYEDARDIMLLAYDRKPENRQICYSLCELYIKTGEPVEAAEFYKEFEKLAPKDPGRYILKYKLYDAYDVSLDEKIEVLEKLKEEEYQEKWMYELANLYHRRGLGTKCVEVCDELILWFGTGKYVNMAMELKMLHEPLTPAQQKKYDNRFLAEQEEYAQAAQEDLSIAQAHEQQQVTARITHEWKAGDVEQANAEAMGQTRVFNVDEVRRQTGYAGHDDMDIQVKTVGLGQYDTMNLQAELAEGLREVLENEKAAPSSNAQENVFQTTRILPVIDSDSGPLDLPVMEGVEDEDLESEPIEAKAPEKVEATEVFFENNGGMIQDENGYFHDTAEFSKDQLSDQVMAQMRKDEKKSLEKEAMTAQPPERLAKVLTQESDGQLKLVVPEHKKLEKQITGQISIDDIRAEWEMMKQESQAKQEEETRQQMLRQTGRMFTEFEEAIRDNILKNMEDQIDPATLKAPQGGTAQKVVAPVADVPVEDWEMENISHEEFHDASQEQEAGAAEARAPFFGAVEAAADEAAEEAKETVEEVTEEAQETVAEAAEEVSETATEAAQATDAALAAVADEVQETATEATQEFATEAEEAQEAATEAVQEVADETSEFATEAAQEVQEIMTEAEEAQAFAEETAQEFATETEATLSDATKEYGEVAEEAEATATEVAEEAQEALNEAAATEEAQEALNEAAATEEAQEAMNEAEALAQAYTESTFAAFAREKREAAYAQEAEGEGEEVSFEWGEESFGASSEAAGESEEAQRFAGETEEEESARPMEGNAFWRASREEADEPAAGGIDFETLPQEDVVLPESTFSEKRAIEAERMKEFEEPDDDQITHEIPQATRSLSPEEEALYAPWIRDDADREQLVSAIDNVSMAAYVGNLIITGEASLNTLDLAKKMISEIKQNDSNLTGKVAKIPGQSLNNRDVNALMDGLQNGALIIEKATNMNDTAVENLYRNLQRENFGVIVVLLDTRKNVKKFLRKHEELRPLFNVRVDVLPLSNEALADFARQYANEREFSIDNLGMLALHTKIDELQTANHAVTCDDVEKIMEEAIDSASRKTLGHFFDIIFGRRYDADDMIIITEKDFMT
ncbi:MAG: hypothetical protein IKH28_08185 [Lachnospiraceae bacterium]|nr:hypothetical protein [Lachnospiraceae bacterium]